MSVSLLFVGGECHRCHLLGSLCSHTHGGRCYVGDCDIQGQRGPYALLAWPRVITLPESLWGDVPERATAPPDRLSKRFPRVGSAVVWRTSSEVKVNTFVGRCPAEWFSCYWECALYFQSEYRTSVFSLVLHWSQHGGSSVFRSGFCLIFSDGTGGPHESNSSLPVDTCGLCDDVCPSYSE